MLFLETLGSADIYFYMSVKRLIWFAFIGHFLLYSITIKCLNCTIFWTLDEVSSSLSQVFRRIQAKMQVQENDTPKATIDKLPYKQDTPIPNDHLWFKSTNWTLHCAYTDSMSSIQATCVKIMTLK